MILKPITYFKTFEEAKRYAMESNHNDNQIMIIKHDTNFYYICPLKTDNDISLILESLLEYMNDYNCYIVGFTYNFNGWDSSCKLYIDINF